MKLLNLQFGHHYVKLLEMFCKQLNQELTGSYTQPFQLRGVLQAEIKLNPRRSIRLGIKNMNSYIEECRYTLITLYPEKNIRVELELAFNPLTLSLYLHEMKCNHFFIYPIKSYKYNPEIVNFDCEISNKLDNKLIHSCFQDLYYYLQSKSVI